MRSRPWELAVDFGTSFTSAATAVEGRIQVLEVGPTRYLPSTVCLGPAGELLVGRDALNEAVVRPAWAERLPKRAMAASDRVRRLLPARSRARSTSTSDAAVSMKD